MIFMNKLIHIFKAKSITHLFLIFLIFGISGSLSVIISEPLLNYLNIKYFISNNIVYFIIRLIIIFPIYQIVLIIIASLFGEYKYFLAFEKKMLKRLTFF